MKNPSMQTVLKNDPLLRNFFEAENLFPSNWLNAFDNDASSLNITEDADNFYVDVIAAGFRKEDFHVHIEDDIISIHATAASSNIKINNSGLWKTDYQTNAFRRSFRLPENIRKEMIAAVYKDGMLKLTIPKYIAVKNKEVQVQ